MSINPDEHDARGKTRREFLRKSAYVTPTLLSFGSLNRPAKAQCDPFVDPNCNGDSGPIVPMIPGMAPSKPRR